MWPCDINIHGKINGNYHFGHIMLECFKKRNPDGICQIDAATDERECYGSVLSRTIIMARSFRRAGFHPGDVLALGGKNHLNLRIPCYAAMMEGLPVGGIDPMFKYEEIKSALRVLRPKIAFCDYEKHEHYKQAVEELGLDTKIVTFYDGECSMAKFMEDGYEEAEEYRPSYFDTDKIYVWLLSTSGTSGVLKFAAIKHEAAVLATQNVMRLMFGESKTGNGHQRVGLNVSPVQWLTACLNATMYPLTNTILLQSSNVSGIESYIVMVNKYKPSKLMLSPSLLSLILKHEKHCDCTCLDTIAVGGAKVYRELLHLTKARMCKGARVFEIFGSSELTTPIIPNTNTPVGSCGADVGVSQFKLVDATTGAEVTEPHKHGELWAKGPACFTEYYNNPAETAASLTEDGWFKTGDVMYRDEEQNFYFVDRLKMLIKYRNIHVIPPELEEVISGHPGVLEVCVTGIPHPDDGERPAACVVRRPGRDVTAQEIKDLIAENLSDSKQLRGGVVFVDNLPKTSTGKVMRPKVQSLVKDLLKCS